MTSESGKADSTSAAPRSGTKTDRSRRKDAPSSDRRTFASSGRKQAKASKPTIVTGPQATAPETAKEELACSVVRRGVSTAGGGISADEKTVTATSMTAAAAASARAAVDAEAGKRRSTTGNSMPRAAVKLEEGLPFLVVAADATMIDKHVIEEKPAGKVRVMKTICLAPGPDPIVSYPLVFWG